MNDGGIFSTQCITVIIPLDDTNSNFFVSKTIII